MKKTEKILLACGAAAVALPTFLLAPGRATKGQKAPFPARARPGDQGTEGALLGPQLRPPRPAQPRQERAGELPEGF